MVVMQINGGTGPEMKLHHLRRQGWKSIASGRTDSEGKFSFQMKVTPALAKAGKQEAMAILTDEDGNIVKTSNTVDILVRRPSGSCPKCYNPTYPTGESLRIPVKLTASRSKRRSGKKWAYETEHQCTRCRRKFPQSRIAPYEE